MPVNSSDSGEDDEELGNNLYNDQQMEDMARHSMDYTKDTMYGDNLEYAMDGDDSEESDLLLSSMEMKKHTLSNSRIYVANSIGGDTPDDEFIVIDNM
eukprot:CAMPEP_0201566292 /NCGR_PEP_ID=MMETSP0190_2-20130828/5990_1 /ASSEMBLY_ACC=CAM_ASM_000263 /TAXON_ID=37353 /ORGANISM="Rosalina sp." /LENGTH=97 /DNA_ID=CAMNT_0047984819 /DNA_START=956 /DNA_END=1249 /DNA_ORIENTATION=+